MVRTLEEKLLWMAQEKGATSPSLALAGIGYNDEEIFILDADSGQTWRVVLQKYKKY
jgi:hypothetical protein